MGMTDPNTALAQLTIDIAFVGPKGSPPQGKVERKAPARNLAPRRTDCNLPNQVHLGFCESID